MEILTEIFPTVQRIGVLYNPLDYRTPPSFPTFKKAPTSSARK